MYIRLMMERPLYAKSSLSNTSTSGEFQNVSAKVDVESGTYGLYGMCQRACYNVSSNSKQASLPEIQ